MTRHALNPAECEGEGDKTFQYILELTDVVLYRRSAALTPDPTAQNLASGMHGCSKSQLSSAQLSSAQLRLREVSVSDDAVKVKEHQDDRRDSDSDRRQPDPCSICAYWHWQAARQVRQRQSAMFPERNDVNNYYLRLIQLSIFTS